MKIIQNFSKPYGPYKAKVKVELDFSDFSKKSQVKEVTTVNESEFAKKVQLTNLKITRR